MQIKRNLITLRQANKHSRAILNCTGKAVIVALWLLFVGSFVNEFLK